MAEDCQVYRAYFENGERSDREKWMSRSVAKTHYHRIDVEISTSPSMLSRYYSIAKTLIAKTFGTNEHGISRLGSPTIYEQCINTDRSYTRRR